MSKTEDIQDFLEKLGLLSPGLYKRGSLDSETRSAIESAKTILDEDDIDKLINNFDLSGIQPKNPTERVRPSSNTRISNTRSTPLTATRSSQSRSSFTYDNINCYIINQRTNSTIQFNLESPDSISESTGANFNSTSTKGRSHPWMSYDSSKGRSGSFTLALNDDYCAEGLKSTVSKLKALSYPIAEGDRIVAPLCTIKIGTTLSLPYAVITSIDVSWKKPYRNGLYLNAEVTVSYEEVVSKSVSQTEAEAGA